MTHSTSNAALHRRLVLLWTAIAVVMAGVVAWGATQVDDPLARYIHTDKMRHILAFGAIGLCAGLMPSPRPRLVALGAVITFALLVEIIQIPIPERSASISDLFASSIGAFAGFGFGAASLIAWESMRQPVSRAQTRAPPRT